MQTTRTKRMSKLCHGCARYGCSNKHVENGKCPYRVPSQAYKHWIRRGMADLHECIYQKYNNNRREYRITGLR